MINISEPQMGPEEEAAVLEVLRSGRLAQGPRVEQFEEEFAAYVGASYGVAVGNGTQALHLALLAHGVEPYDEVITTPFTFVATASAITMCRAAPVFVDVEEDTGNIDWELAARESNGSRAVVPVHLYGHPVSHQAQWFDPVIFDACQAHGAKQSHGVSGAFYNVGYYGTSCWSFYATKNMTTGEGGMVTTNYCNMRDELRLLRNHGSPRRYEYANLGYNYRMTEIQAAIGIEQLKQLPAMQAKRTRNAAYYTDGLAGIEGIALPTVRAGCTHAWHQYTIRVLAGREARDGLAEHLKHAGIGTGIYYPTILPKTELFAGRHCANEEFPVAERLSAQVLSLPVHPGLSEADLETVVAQIELWEQEL